jgi:hypothetical protein
LPISTGKLPPLGWGPKAQEDRFATLRPRKSHGAEFIADVGDSLSCRHIPPQRIVSTDEPTFHISNRRGLRKDKKASGRVRLPGSPEDCFTALARCSATEQPICSRSWPMAKPKSRTAVSGLSRLLDRSQQTGWMNEMRMHIVKRLRTPFGECAPSIVIVNHAPCHESIDVKSAAARLKMHLLSRAGAALGGCSARLPSFRGAKRMQGRMCDVALREASTCAYSEPDAEQHAIEAWERVAPEDQECMPVLRLRCGTGWVPKAPIASTGAIQAIQ